MWVWDDGGTCVGLVMGGLWIVCEGEGVMFVVCSWLVT